MGVQLCVVCPRQTSRIREGDRTIKNLHGLLMLLVWPVSERRIKLVGIPPRLRFVDLLMSEGVEIF